MQNFYKQTYHTYKFLQKIFTNPPKMKTFKTNTIHNGICLLLALCLLTFSVKSEGLTFAKLVQILQESNKSPFVNMFFIYDSSTQTGKQLEEFVPIVTASKKDYYQVNLLDCNTEDEEVIKSFPFCAKDFRTKLPALMFTEPELNPTNPITGQINQAKQHQYQGPLNQKSLFDFALPLMKAFSSNLKNVKEYEKFKQNNKEVPHIIYFTDKEKLPVIYKILTAHFRNTIAFSHVMKDSPLAAHFNITKFPTMLLNGKQQVSLSKNLNEMIGRFNVIKGDQSNIVIEEYQSAGKEQLNSQNLQKLVYELPEHILVHINDPSGEMHPQWKKCQQSFKKMFTYYETDHLIKQLGIKQTPAIVYFPKSLAKKQVQKTIFTSKDSFRNIYDEISSLIQDFSVPLANDVEMQKLTSIPLMEGKFIAVLFHEDDISLSYRVLSNEEKYKKDIVFFRMKDPEQAVLQKFQIKKLPTLYIMINEPEQEDEKKNNEDAQQGRVHMNLKLAHYNGKFNYDDLSRYFNMFSKQQKTTEQTSTESNQEANLIEITSQKKFKKHCLQQNCYILLVDGRNSKNDNNQVYKNQIKKFVKQVLEDFTVIDGSCHNEILGPLQIQQDQLPTLIYLNSKFQKWIRIIGRIQQRSLNVFISKIKSNKANYRAYDKISFDDKKNCEEEHKKLDEYQNGSSSEQVLSETEQQILREIKEEEQNKKREMQRIEKQLQKNDRKKRRRRRPKNEQDSDLEDL